MSWSFTKFFVNGRRARLSKEREERINRSVDQTHEALKGAAEALDEMGDILGELGKDVALEDVAFFAELGKKAQRIRVLAAREPTPENLAWIDRLAADIQLSVEKHLRVKR